MFDRVVDHTGLRRCVHCHGWQTHEEFDGIYVTCRRCRQRARENLRRRAAEHRAVVQFEDEDRADYSGVGVRYGTIDREAMTLKGREARPRRGDRRGERVLELV